MNMTIVDRMKLPLNGFEDVRKQNTSERICGVYVLFYGNRVIYVGQSVDVRARIATHKIEKPYTRCFVKELPQEKLTEVEGALITILQPPLNRAGVLKDYHESEHAHRLIALADLVKRISNASGWHDAKQMAKAEAIIRKQAEDVSAAFKQKGW